MLKSLRGKHAWTQAEAGKLLGVTQSAIARYEKGERTMDGPLARKVYQLHGGMTFEEIKQMELAKKKLRQQLQPLSG